MKDYLDNNGMFDAFAAVEAFSNSYLYFLKDDIVWNGVDNELKGFQVSKIDWNQNRSFANNIKEYSARLAQFLMYLEADSALYIPSQYVHPNLKYLLRSGELTGLSMFSLLGFDSVFAIDKIDDTILVKYDYRLYKSIPDFYNLTSRFIWDLVSFNTHITSLDVRYACLGSTSPDFPGMDFDPVEGAASYYTKAEPLHYTSRPKLNDYDLPNTEDDIKEFVVDEQVSVKEPVLEENSGEEPLTITNNNNNSLAVNLDKYKPYLSNEVINNINSYKVNKDQFKSYEIEFGIYKDLIASDLDIEYLDNPQEWDLWDADRVEGPSFSFGIPSGMKVIQDCKDFVFDSPIVLVRDDVDVSDCLLVDKIAYCVGSQADTCSDSDVSFDTTFEGGECRVSSYECNGVTRFEIIPKELDTNDFIAIDFIGDRDDLSWNTGMFFADFVKTIKLNN